MHVMGACVNKQVLGLPGRILRGFIDSFSTSLASTSLGAAVQSLSVLARREQSCLGREIPAQCSVGASARPQQPLPSPWRWRTLGSSHSWAWTELGGNQGSAASSSCHLPCGFPGTSSLPSLGHLLPQGCVGTGWLVRAVCWLDSQEREIRNALLDPI